MSVDSPQEKGYNKEVNIRVGGISLKAINRWIDRFSFNHPNFGISNLMLYIGVANVAVYLIDLFNPSRIPLSSILMFSRDAILHGQIWRLLTFIMVSESGDMFAMGTGIFFVAISAFFYYWIGSLLEREWGTAKFTLFYVSGVVLNIVYGMFTGYASMYYVNLSMFFAMATLYGDVYIRLFYILPVKMKWVAWIDAALFLWTVVANLLSLNLIGAILPIVAILNYLIFFYPTLQDMVGQTARRQKQHRSPQAINFRKAQKEVRNRKGYLHKCTVCGITDADDPDMEFRYCSKCNGYYCYCMNHINNHTHIQ